MYLNVDGQDNLYIVLADSNTLTMALPGTKGAAAMSRQISGVFWVHAHRPAVHIGSGMDTVLDTH